jgi:hypothetical protein
MTNDDEIQVLTTCSEVWEFLVEQAGLDLRHYDTALADDLMRHLGVAASPKNLGAALDQSGVSVEGLIGAFLKAVEPYARMMSDLCVFFYRHGIEETNEAVRMLFDFGTGPTDLGFDLRHFREWLCTWQRVTQNVLVFWLNHNELWMLTGVLREAAPPRNRLSRDVEEWLGRYRRAGEILPLPSTPHVGSAEADKILARVWRVWETIVLACARYGTTWEQFRIATEDAARSEREDEREALASNAEQRQHLELPSFRDWDPRTLRILDSDHWQSQTLGYLSGWTTYLSELPPAERELTARPVVAKIEDIFGSLPRAEETREALQRASTELLKLPIWKRRHELYQAWVLTEIVGALDGYPLEVHHVGGSLVLRFSGTHVATASSTEGHILVWSELRSPLERPRGKGRKAHIQPDYSLAMAPITEPSSTRVAVECKQYRRQSTRSFADTVTDYARGRPAAHVVLVNYGPADDDILQSVGDDVQDRVTFFGLFRPGNEVPRKDFRDLVRSMLPAPAPQPAIALGGVEVIAIDVSGSMKDVLERGQVRRMVELVVASSPKARIVAIDTSIRLRGPASGEFLQRVLDFHQNGRTDLPGALAGLDLNQAFVVTDSDGWNQLVEAGTIPRLAVVTEDEVTEVKG